MKHHLMHPQKRNSWQNYANQGQVRGPDLWNLNRTILRPSQYNVLLSLTSNLRHLGFLLSIKYMVQQSNDSLDTTKQ